ncbi:hypothetical protein Forpi1262_v015761 [Fusarium oxysporum f. sp. raphani]|uniref:Uncharacterized protein n=1 Tax=Fusarium oxysporum f. sp. raphani TaxID=96318 RepID=A0A8J5U0A9_FUSOX|nr:hypothetical protein Forpi1262_v015761 [Fusarium oxysporum f. sp. raphani]
MEPLSITSGVVGVAVPALQCAQQLRKTIQVILDAPSEIASLRQELLSEQHYSAPETRDERMLHAIDMGWFIMNKYYRYTMTEDVPVYSVALLLDPSNRDANIKQNWPDEWYDNAIGGAQAI